MVLSRIKHRAERNREALITHTSPDSLISEQFRMIQANIKFAIDDPNSGVFLITSPSNGEGKSTIAANLASTIVQQKEKVLLIDANLRSPTLHTFFQIPNTIGLIDVLMGKVTLDEAINHTEIGRLDVLPSGLLSFNPIELLGSKMMQGMLKTASQRYDVVIVDSHAVMDVIDTKLLASLCDGVILVVKGGNTACEKAVEAKKQLEFSKSKLVGVIFNQ